MTKGDNMDEEKEGFGDTTFVEGMVETADEIATGMMRTRNLLLEQGFSPQTAEAAALQHQSFTHALILENVKQQERPRGLFG